MSSRFPHRHLLGIDQLGVSDVTALLDLAENYVIQNRSAQRGCNRLAGKTVVNMFFEPSTRTRTSFELAARRLGADLVNLSIEHSSTKKGETLLDTVRNIDAMQVDALVVRHRENGAHAQIAPHLRAAVVNAGEGSQEHPTQALLDAMTIRKRKGRLEGLNVMICGDIEHSRVARANIRLLNKFGVKPRLVAPSDFLPRDRAAFQVTCSEDMAEGLRDVDVILMLRIQHERLAEGEFAMSLKDYHQRYGLDHAKIKLARPDALVLHPGPLNREVEISSALADDPQHSAILQQVEHGVAVRMAVLDLLLGAS